MSIASRITAITGHITDIYDTLELGGDTTQNKNIVNINTEIKREYKDFLANGTDTLWNNWEKVSGTGEALSLSPTIKGKMKVDLKGNTQQNGTPTPDTPIPVQVVSGDNTIKVEGKNLLSVNNETFTREKAFDINTIPAGTYTFTCNCTSTDTDASQCVIIFQNGSTNVLAKALNRNTNVSMSITLNDEINKIDLYASDTWVHGEGDTATFTNMMVSTSGGEYQPYQSTTYPISLGNIELCKIGTYQDSIKKSTGKNLFDISTITENTWMDEWGQTGSSSVTNLSDYIEIKENTQFKLSYNYNTLLNNTQRGICFYNESKTFISGVLYNSIDKQISFTTPNNAKYVRFAYDKNCFDIMINEGTTALPYEPYGTGWYLNKQIGKVVLDGTETGWYARQNAYVYAYQMAINTMLANNDNNKKMGCFMNYYTENTPNQQWSLQIGEKGFSITKDVAYINVSNGETTAELSTFKTWLSTHNLIFYYVLATPTYTEITDTTLLSQLEALAYSYEGTTNISQVNDDMPFILDITALKNI